MWSDSWQFSYSNWASGFNTSIDQQSYCGFLNDKDNLWNVTSCSSQNDFICKISKGEF